MQVGNAIILRENNKAKQLIEEYIHFGTEHFFEEALKYNNAEIGKWMLENYDMPIENHCQYEIYDKDRIWFVESCMQNEKYKKALQNYRDRQGNSLLHGAITRKNSELIKILLKHNFDPSLPNNKNYTPYYLISESNLKEKDELLSILASKGANNKLDDQTINNAFIDGLNSNDFKKIHKYLKLGADPNQTIPLNLGRWNSAVDTLPAIYSCIASHNESVAELLLLYGANPNVHSEKYGSPLQLAVDNYKSNIIRMLVYKGADVNYVRAVNNDNSCDQPLILLEKMKMNGYDVNGNKVYTKLTYSVPTKADSLLFEAVVKDDITKLKQLFKSIEENGDYYHSRKLEDTVWSSGSVKMIHYFMKNRGNEFTNDTLEIIRKAVFKKRLDILASLSTNFFAHIDLTKVLYTDPFMAALSMTRRSNSFNTVYSIFSPSIDNMPDTTLASRNLSLEMVKLMDSRFERTNTKRYINTCIENRLYEHFCYFLQKLELKEDEVQAFLNITNHNNTELQKQLENGLSPDVHLNQFSLLACATWADNAKAVKLLLDKGADVSFFNNSEEVFYKTHLKPSMWAVILCNEENIKSLISKGADFQNLYFPDENIYYSSAYTLLLYKKEKWPILLYFLDKEIIHYATGNNATTLITQAINMDDPELVELLLKYPPDENYYLNFKKSYYYAPTNMEECISYALKENSEKTFFYLVNKAGKDKFNYEEYYLEYCNNIQIIKWLIENGYSYKGEESVLRILVVALRNNDKEFFYSVLKTIDQNLINQIFSGYKVKELFKIIYDQEMLDVLKYIFDNYIEYDKKYFEQAVLEGKKEFIRYFIFDRNANWLDYSSSKHTIIFKQC